MPLSKIPQSSLYRLGDFCLCFSFSFLLTTVTYNLLLVNSLSLQISSVERQQAQIMAASADTEEFVSWCELPTA